MVRSVGVQVDRQNNSVTVDVDSSVPATFGQLAGIQKFDIPKSSVAIYDSKDIEIGLQLDVTGSMCSPCRKMNDLKDAVAGSGGLLDILLPNGGTLEQGSHRSRTVRLGRQCRPVCRRRQREPRHRRLRLRAPQHGLQATEAPAVGPASLKARVDLGSPQRCPTDARVVPMTNDKAHAAHHSQRLEHLDVDGRSSRRRLGLVPDLARSGRRSGPARRRPPTTTTARPRRYVILMTDGVYNTIGGQTAATRTSRCPTGFANRHLRRDEGQGRDRSTPSASRFRHRIGPRCSVAPRTAPSSSTPATVPRSAPPSGPSQKRSTAFASLAETR